MSRDPNWPDNPFWKFSLTLYARARVAPACLALQDRHGLDVNVLLYCIWLGVVRGVRLADADMTQIVVSVKEWHDRVVRPLRALRTELKGEAFGAPRALSDALRNDLKVQELNAERIEQQILFTQIWSDAPGATRSTFVARENVQTYLKCLGIQPDSNDEAQVGNILGEIES